MVAKPEYATAKIAVWWDMKDCPIPVGYDPGRVRRSMEMAFKGRGYSGPVSITAYGDKRQTPNDVLRALSSSGVAFAHSIPENTWSVMYADLLEWRGRNPPPATMMLISDHVDDVLAWDLARLQQHTQYNLFLAYSLSSDYESLLVASAEWRWKRLLLSSADNEHETKCTELSAMFYCKSCSFHSKSLRDFRKHFSSRKHVKEEVENCGNGELDPVTRMWARNYAAKPEYATAQIAVWWDMYDCPIPEGYDPRRVRSSIEAAFRSLGYSGPVSITAYGDQNQTPDDLLRGLSSTGVDFAHSVYDVKYKRMFSDMIEWQYHNPPPATMMLISDQVEEVFADGLVQLQQLKKYNLFLSYSFRPYKMSILVTSAEWLFDSLLAVSETRRQFLQRCSERGASTGMFHCKSCFFDCTGFDNFKNHLSSNEHALEEDDILSSIRLSEYEQEHSSLEMETYPKRKAFPAGFHLLQNHLRRLRARKSQTRKNPLGGEDEDYDDKGETFDDDDDAGGDHDDKVYDDVAGGDHDDKGDDDVGDSDDDHETSDDKGETSDDDDDDDDDDEGDGDGDDDDGGDDDGKGDDDDSDGYHEGDEKFVHPEDNMTSDDSDDVYTDSDDDKKDDDGDSKKMNQKGGVSDAKKGNENGTDGWWDHENAGIPHDLAAATGVTNDKLYKHIRKRLRREGFTGRRLKIRIVVPYKNSYIPPNLSKQIKVRRAKRYNSPKDFKAKNQVADIWIKANIQKWLSKNPELQNTLLVTGDNGFKGIIKNLNRAKHTTLLIYRDNSKEKSISEKVKEEAKHKWGLRPFLGAPENSISKKNREPLYRQRKEDEAEAKAKAALLEKGSMRKRKPEKTADKPNKKKKGKSVAEDKKEKKSNLEETSEKPKNKEGKGSSVKSEKEQGSMRKRKPEKTADKPNKKKKGGAEQQE